MESYKINYSKVLEELQSPKQIMQEPNYELEFEKCKNIYQEIGGSRNINPFTFEEFNKCISSLNNLKDKLEEIKPDFLHIIYGGECRYDHEGFMDCLNRRYFWPYFVYCYNLFTESADKETLVLPKLSIIILDPKVNELTNFPIYIRNLEEVFIRKITENIDINYIKDIYLPVNQDCLINNLISEIILNVISNGGLVSFLNEIKALHDRDVNKIHPFTKFEEMSFNNPNKIIFLNWYPNIRYSQRSIQKIKDKVGYEVSLNNLNDCLLSTKLPDYVKSERNFQTFINSYISHYNLSEAISGFNLNKSEPYSFINMNPNFHLGELYIDQLIPNIIKNEEYFWIINNNKDLLFSINI